MDSKVFVFSKEEYLVLAAAAGIRQFYGFSMETENMDEQSTLLAMQKLSQKNILLSINGKFQIQEPVASLFLQMKNAASIIDVHKRSGRKCIVYIRDFGVKVSLSQRRQGMLEIQQVLIGEIWKHLIEEGWIPEEKGELS